MQMNHIEMDLPVNSELIKQALAAEINHRDSNNQLQHKRAELNLILNFIEKKYGVLVSEIRDNNEVSFTIASPPLSRRVEGRSFVIGKYSNEHMMRNFARYLNRGRLSRKNIDETIYEMKSLQSFCK